jgi:hypothetical protein
VYQLLVTPVSAINGDRPLALDVEYGDEIQAVRMVFDRLAYGVTFRGNDPVTSA